jgi:hypothetical protein
MSSTWLGSFVHPSQRSNTSCISRRLVELLGEHRVSGFVALDSCYRGSGNSHFWSEWL